MHKACYYILFLISFFLYFNSILTAETWPIEKHNLLSSSFGEFRNGRLHAGIDIKTNHCTGLPVKAFKKGRIFRLSYNLRGYGKVLYIIHEDKSFSVYAHLKKFENKVLKLENILKEEQKKRNKYFGIDMNIYSRAIWVDEGDIVAYSGESGVGFPHLHFELRRNIFTPINPLSCKEIIKKVKDTKAPVIRGLTVFPLYNTARVNSHFFPIRYEVDNLSGNICKVNKTIYLNSNDLTQYLISIDLHDKSDKSSSKLGIYSIQIKINGKKIYNDRINDIDYRSNKKGWLYFNQYLSSTYAGRYYFNLLPDYRQLGNLPTFKKMFPTSPVNLKTGLNILTAEYKDYHGNKVVLKADIFCSSFVFNKNYSGLDLNRTIDYFNDGRFSTLSNTKNKFKYSQKHKKISSIEKSNYFTLDFSKTFTTGEIFEDLKPGKRLRKLVFIKNGDALKVGNCEFKNNCGEDILLIKKSTSGKIFKNKSIKFHTPVWEIFPKNLRFAKNKNLGITFFHTDYTKEMLKKIGLFSINKKSNSLSLTGHGISKKSMNIQSLKSFSGKYTFASDLSDPKITKVFRNNQKRLVAKFKDIGKGINWLSIDVQNKKDGKSIPGIPDPDRGQWVSIKKIPKNINVVITVKDRADNICVKNFKL